MRGSASGPRGTAILPDAGNLPELSAATDDPIRYFGPFLFAATQVRQRAVPPGDPSALPIRLAHLLSRARDRAATAIGTEASNDCTYLCAVLLDHSAVAKRDALAAVWPELRLEHKLCRTSSYGKHLGRRIEQIVERGHGGVLRVLVSALASGLDLAIDGHERKRLVELAKLRQSALHDPGSPTFHPGPPPRAGSSNPLIGPWTLASLVVAVVCLVSLVALGVRTVTVIGDANAAVPSATERSP